MGEGYPLDAKRAVRECEEPRRDARVGADDIGPLVAYDAPQAVCTPEEGERVLALHVHRDVPPAVRLYSRREAPAGGDHDILPAARRKRAVHFHDAALDATLLKRGQYLQRLQFYSSERPSAGRSGE